MTQPPEYFEFDPAAGRTNPPYLAGDRESLDSWLDFHRAALLSKCEGLDDERLRTRSVPPSSLSLLGLIRHMTEVERNWFRRVLLDEEVAPLYCSDDVDSADVAADFTRFRAELEHCRKVAAQHHGHADFLRERIDGVTAS